MSDRERDRRSVERDPGIESKEKACPRCATPVSADEEVCPTCGADILHWRGEPQLDR